MYKEVTVKKFKKDIKLLNKQKKDLSKLSTVINLLKEGQSLDPRYKDHLLDGDKTGSRDCHIEPDWILIYRIDKTENKLWLLRTGSHANLFNESIQNELPINQLNKRIDEVMKHL